MPVSDMLTRVIAFLRAGYPDGVPGHDYIPLLALLRHRLSDDEVIAVANELATGAENPVDGIDVSVAITKLTNELPSPEDTERVKQRLAAAGWPVTDGFDTSESARAMTSRDDEQAQQSRYSADTEMAQAPSPTELPTPRERLLTEARQYQKIHYPLVTRFSGGELLLLNNGYEEDPPMALPLSASDEPDRLGLQLYHRTATQVDLSGKRVLEVGCGHGGGASYLVRTLGPTSYTGLDVNSAGIDFCRKRHNLPRLDFVAGDAENLPFPDQSFDAVINVESSHCYLDFPGFLAGVARVLRPGGHFLYADARHSYDDAPWQAALANAPMRMLSQRSISAEVARGLEKNLQHSIDAVVYKRIFPEFLHGFVDHIIGTNHMRFCRDLQSGAISYWMYRFAKT